MKYLFGLPFIGLAVFFFWLAFLKVAPYVSSLLPNNEWHSFLSLIIYILIAWCGGVGLPLFLFIIGMYFIIAGD